MNPSSGVRVPTRQERGIPNIKLFKRGAKKAPITYEGEREVQAWMAFLAAECKLKSGANLLDAQFAAYAVRCNLVHRLRVRNVRVDVPFCHRVC